MQAGAVGVCVQKTSEAEALAAGGVNDIFISNEVIAPQKLQRVARLAAELHARGGRLAIAGGQPAGRARAGACPEPSSSRLPDRCAGRARCGPRPLRRGDARGRRAVARVIARHPAAALCRPAGLHGRAQHLRGVQERRDAFAAVLAVVQSTSAQLQAAGLPAALVTGAGTGTFALEAASGVYGELQAGSYLFMDADYARNEADPAQPPFEHAAVRQRPRS